MASPLARKRKELKLTVEQVASGVGCSAPNYWRIESGEQQPRKNLLQAIIRYFDNQVTEMEILFPERYVTEGYFEDLTQEENAE
ncbi:helix-turn-helix transcriptional regulator [Acinetobacter baumannii]|uniref:helix-turn-helix transcriptional regulator n=1 Tax=Acinetobacter baumannii TaxID=470 RepID=UPI001360DDC3|nr:helix-turn-helix transcriptional regulator [Acinetobacter baumannii]MBF6695242.1 helix-turn-helix transcriptional regulator [Acinetobacter baumannii]MBF6781547.1 helix-turn-helix transcriptional regulator [Acinetobacter baumannii]MBF6961818.1 helix-turn-helix transcriptional regulator [Acinetobacter baumannii]MBF8326110.1 helix-turn-helix transcriptional regulator [Acinetobacter baumannii]MDP7818229.1 helix-turn-helix transcriptional regulator [Acinetobacter baumannii]